MGLRDKTNYWKHGGLAPLKRTAGQLHPPSGRSSVRRQYCGERRCHCSGHTHVQGHCVERRAKGAARPVGGVASTSRDNPKCHDHAQAPRADSVVAGSDEIAPRKSLLDEDDLPSHWYPGAAQPVGPADLAR